MLSKIVIICMAMGAIAAPVKINEEAEVSLAGHCGIRDAVSVAFTKTDKMQHYRHLAHKIKNIYHETLEYGSGDLEEYHKWRNQFQFLPTIDDANAENQEVDYHKHLQMFVVSFQFLKKVQDRYDNQFSQPLGKLELKALRVLCAMENNRKVTWSANYIDAVEMNEKISKFNLGVIDPENQNYRNYRFTQMLFRQYLDELHKKIMSFVL